MATEKCNCVVPADMVGVWAGVGIGELFSSDWLDFSHGMYGWMDCDGRKHVALVSDHKEHVGHGRGA